MTPYAGTPADPAAAGTPPRVTIAGLRARREAGTPIVTLTAYDFPSARIAAAAGVDVVLAGDSAANVVLGYASTREISVEELLMLTAATRRGLDHPEPGATHTPMLLGDLPFGTYEDSDEQAVATALRFVREGGCDAVKLEGGGAMVERSRAIIAAGVPVVGHVGLLPQSVQPGGDWRVQGRTADDAMAIAREAIALERAGCFALVLEAVPAPLTELLQPLLGIPTIGIGAGGATDGQVLVYHDVLGLSTGRSPRFVKRYAEAREVMVAAVRAFAGDVRAGSYPGPEHTYGMEPAEVERLRTSIGSLRGA